VKKVARAAAVVILSSGLVRLAHAASPMTQSMQMNDAAPLGMLWLDQAEGRLLAAPSGAAWQGEGWYGDDYDKAWVRTEGEPDPSGAESARAELFWDRAILQWWNVDLGVRQDFGAGPGRSWAALGVHGIAPQGVDAEATLYAGSGERISARLKLDYELLFTQRLILQPEVEMNLYGRADPARSLGAGVSDLEIGLRLRYEVRREFAPYVGVVWERRWGRTASFWSAAGEDPSELTLALGLRVWL
jgi:copper resistance protein B